MYFYEKKFEFRQRQGTWAPRISDCVPLPVKIIEERPQTDIGLEGRDGSHEIVGDRRKRVNSVVDDINPRVIARFTIWQ